MLNCKVVWLWHKIKSWTTETVWSHIFETNMLNSIENHEWIQMRVCVCCCMCVCVRVLYQSPMPYYHNIINGFGQHYLHATWRPLCHVGINRDGTCKLAIRILGSLELLYRVSYFMSFIDAWWYFVSKWLLVQPKKSNQFIFLIWMSDG